MAFQIWRDDSGRRRVLTVGGKVAVHEDCCCGECYGCECQPAWYHWPESIAMDIAALGIQFQPSCLCGVACNDFPDMVILNRVACDYGCYREAYYEIDEDFVYCGAGSGMCVNYWIGLVAKIHFRINDCDKWIYPACNRVYDYISLVYRDRLHLPYCTFATTYGFAGPVVYFQDCPSDYFTTLGDVDVALKPGTFTNICAVAASAHVRFSSL